MLDDHPEAVRPLPSFIASKDVIDRRQRQVSLALAEELGRPEGDIGPDDRSTDFSTEGFVVCPMFLDPAEPPLSITIRHSSGKPKPPPGNHSPVTFSVVCTVLVAANNFLSHADAHGSNWPPLRS